jgi:hypothetical protein
MSSESLPHIYIPSVWEKAKGATSGQYEETSLVGGYSIPGSHAPALELHQHDGPVTEPETYVPLNPGYWDFGLLRRTNDAHDILNDRHNQSTMMLGNTGALPTNGTY